MGFDVYGLNPQEHSSLSEDAIKFQDKDGWAMFDKMDDKDKEAYFNAQDKYREENPGYYFRNNVWWWRPLWEFVCTSCDDFLTHKDMDKGGYNDGKKISKTKSLKISKRLSKLIADGTVDMLERRSTLAIEKAKTHNKEVRKEMDAISDVCKRKHGKDLVPANYPEPYKTEWNDAYAKEDWTSSYPFYADNVKLFATFCQQSGGFQIC